MTYKTFKFKEKKYLFLSFKLINALKSMSLS
jgi:hypothetical protein